MLFTVSNNKFVFFKKYILFILKFILTYFLTTFYANSNDPKEKLKQIEKELEKNHIIEKTLKKKQKKIDLDIKKIESLLKKNEDKIQIQLTKKKKIEAEITNSIIEKKSIETTLSNLNKAKKNIIEVILEDTINEKKENYYDLFVDTVYNNIKKKEKLKKKDLLRINDLIILSEEKLNNIEIKISAINNNFLEKSALETSLQGENIITMIQRREKQLENKAIGREAEELKELIESLKTKSTKSRRKKKSENYNFKRLEDILPVKLKNIEKMRTDRAKKGIVLTLKNKSFLTTPNDGIVVYADSFKGYGNMVILDLGNNYHIIYSGLTNIMCSVGDWVNAGRILGEIELKYKNNEVYLEVRFKGKTVNPANWIKS